MAGQKDRWKPALTASLDVDYSELMIGSIGEFSLAIQMKEVPEQRNCGLSLQVHFTKNLELAKISDGVGSQVLRMDIKEMQDVSEKL